MLHGSCACGQITYEIRGELIGPVTYCHCWRCRKHSGSSFGTTAGVATSHFIVQSGAHLFSSWESSEGFTGTSLHAADLRSTSVTSGAPRFLGFALEHSTLIHYGRPSSTS